MRGLRTGSGDKAARAGKPPADAGAARVRQRRSGGRSEVDVSLRLALLQVLEGDFESAEVSIARAVQIDSDAIDAYLALALLYRARGGLGRSIRIHQNLLLRPDLTAEERNTALSELARDFQLGGYERRAIASYEEVLENDRKNVSALSGLCELLTEAGDHARALQLSRRLGKLRGEPSAPQEARLLVRMARAEHDQGHTDAARKLLKKARRLDATYAPAPTLLGEIEAERGKNRAALAAWSAAVKLGGSEVAAVHPKLEATFAALGRPQQYEKFLRELLREREDDAVARLALSRTLAARGAVDPSIVELRALLDRQPANLEARIAVGRLLLGEHREPDALKELAELLSVLEDSAADSRESTP